MFQSAKQRALVGLMFDNELTHLINSADTVQVAFPLRAAPGEQAVAAQKNAFGTGVLSYGALKHQRQLKARPLPGQPDDRPAKFSVELFQFPLSIRAGG